MTFDEDFPLQPDAEMSPCKNTSESICVDRGTSQALTRRAPEPKIASGRVDGVGAMLVERQSWQNPQATWPIPDTSRDLWEDILAIPCANRDQVSSLSTSNYNPVQNAIGNNVLLKHVPSNPDVAPHLQSSSSSSSSSSSPVSTHVEWGSTINLYVLFAKGIINPPPPMTNMLNGVITSTYLQKGSTIHHPLWQIRWLG